MIFVGCKTKKFCTGQGEIICWTLTFKVKVTVTSFLYVTSLIHIHTKYEGQTSSVADQTASTDDTLKPVYPPKLHCRAFNNSSCNVFGTVLNSNLQIVEIGKIHTLTIYT